MEVEVNRDGARGWSFADTGPISIARQQPLFWKYMPIEIKRWRAATGKARQGDDPERFLQAEDRIRRAKFRPA
jgi:hypothetical protein